MYMIGVAVPLGLEPDGAAAPVDSRIPGAPVVVWKDRVMVWAVDGARRPVGRGRYPVSAALRFRTVLPPLSWLLEIHVAPVGLSVGARPPATSVAVVALPVSVSGQSWVGEGRALVFSWVSAFVAAFRE